MEWETFNRLRWVALRNKFVRSRASRSVAVKQKLEDLFHSAKLLHQHLPRQVQHNLRQTAMPVAWRAWDPAQFRMLAQVRRSGADWSEEWNMIVHMLRANHSAGSQAGRQSGGWLI